MLSAIPSILKSFGKIFTFLLVLLAVAAVTYFSIEHDPALALKAYLENRVSPLLFFLLMLFLPPLGVPISIFLVLVGMKFGILPGLAVAAVTMIFHMIFVYWVIDRFFGRRINDVLAKLHISIPALLPKDSSSWPAFLFMIIPGPPYALKNVVLALTEMNLLPYLIINWSAQFGMSIPLIVIGKAVIDMNPGILALAIALLACCYVLQRIARKTFRPRPRDKRQSTHSNE